MWTSARHALPRQSVFTNNEIYMTCVQQEHASDYIVSFVVLVGAECIARSPTRASAAWPLLWASMSHYDFL